MTPSSRSSIADQYVAMLVKARAQSIVCYGQSHAGLFNYPTKVGQHHRGLKGRNILAELIERCHAHDIAVVIYTSLIFDRWAADQHPEWRMVTHAGKPQGEGSRHGVLCPNSPYREYVRAFVTEICETFDFEGIRFDMTFWPSLCFCQHCQKRFADEVGGELPRTIDWLDPRWVAFQRRREAWLAEFAAIPTGTVRKLKPTASVEHQSSTYPLNWQFGVTELLVPNNDFLQGDFYGNSLQGSFVRKLLEELTPNRPFGYETSFSAELRDHTNMKPEALLEAKASAAIADAAAFIFIDAIDPIGTLNPLVYERMGRIFDRLMPYYPHLGGQRVQDVAIYYSLESKYNMATNGRGVDMPDLADAHTASSMQAGRRLIGAHVPFGVITKKSLGKLDGVKLLILSGVNMMDEEEAAEIRAWVQAGGTLLASGSTSLVDKQGRLQKDFLLGDVFGVAIEKADWGDRERYLAPTPAGAAVRQLQRQVSGLRESAGHASHGAQGSRGAGHDHPALAGARPVEVLLDPQQSPLEAHRSARTGAQPFRPGTRGVLGLRHRERRRLGRHVPEPGADAGRRSAFRSRRRPRPSR